jgi:hydrogenase nickel incorporation protein HypB
MALLPSFVARKRVATAIEGWDPGSLDVLFIENVGNLVCPASCDLGGAC